MLSRALSLATVTLLIGGFAAIPVRAENLEAGKSPSQIFAGTCNACHKSPRGLAKTVPAGSLAGFLRQHYTTSPEMASLLSAFLVSNGATDTRYGGSPPKQGKDAKLDARPAGQPEPAERAGSPPAEPGAKGRLAKRLARPGESPDATKPAGIEGQVPAQAAGERGPEGRKQTATQKLSTRGRPDGEEPAKMDPAKEEPSKGDAAKEEKPIGEAAKSVAKSDASKAEPAGLDQPKPSGGGDVPALRADPVPPVTPAPAPVSAAVSSAPPEPAAAAPAAAPPAPPAMAASAPVQAPTGPPAPPISQ
jgi:hypothetical protein